MRDPHANAIRNSLLILGATFLLPASLAYGDLYVDGVLSLEWLVDSSDEILLVHIGPLDADGQPAVNRQSALKMHKVGSRWSTNQSFIERQRWAGPVRGLRVEEDEDWLLFVRATRPDDSASRQVFHGINLTQPLKSYFTAAITREGRPLLDRRTILDAVGARVQLNHRLPPHADRRAIDKLAGRGGNVWAPKDQPGAGTTYLKAHLGGTVVSIDCDYWDRHGGDTLLTRAVVPVEPDDHARFMEAAREVGDSRHASEFIHPIMALVNFPGEESEACLKEIIARYPSTRWRRLADDVLHFFVYHLEPMERENQALFGQWRLEGHRELIDITFTRDQTFVATAFERPRHEQKGPRHLWDGQGYWVVRDGHLSIMRTHVRVGLTWYDGGRELFRSKKIKRIEPAEVVLDGGPPMKRRS